jgi:hypothetical protein
MCIFKIPIMYKIKTPENYKEGDAFKVEFDFWMPFDIVKGLDTLPPDNKNYKKYRQEHWWVLPIKKRDICNVHDLSMFIKDLPVKECKTLEQAIKFAMLWRKKWLKKQLKFKV